MPSRRTFLKQVSASAAAATTIPWSRPALAAGSPSDRLGFAQIGVGHGRWDAHGHAEFADLRMVCDLDEGRAREVMTGLPGGEKAGFCTDYRRLLERSDIDLVSISTVDHWHVKIAIEAMSAGKHVFCQKPLSLTVAEGDLIEAARKRYPNCVFQVGTQQRADERFLRAVNLVQQRLLGRIERVTVGIDGSMQGGPFPLAEVPAGFDWDVWQGQTPDVPYRVERRHGNFRWWYEYSSGKFTDWGAHHVDIALWALQRNGPETPADQRLVRVDGSDAIHPVPLVDGYPTVDDRYNTATDFRVVAEFADGVELVVASRADNGVLFEGELGRCFVNRAKIVGLPIEEEWDAGRFGEDRHTALFKGKPAEGHKANLYRCIREGGETLSDTTSHNATMDVCHLAAISARLGRVVDWDADKRTCPSDPLAAALLSREQRAGYENPVV